MLEDHKIINRPKISYDLNLRMYKSKSDYLMKDLKF